MFGRKDNLPEEPPQAHYCLYAEQMRGGGWRAKLYHAPTLETGFGVPTEITGCGSMVLMGYHRDDVIIGGKHLIHKSPAAACYELLRQLRGVLYSSNMIDGKWIRRRGCRTKVSCPKINAYYSDDHSMVHEITDFDSLRDLSRLPGN